MTAPAAIGAVLFDLDGTFADTAPDLAGALNALRAEAGLSPLPLAQLRPHASQGTRGMLREGFGLMPEDPDYNDHHQRFLAHYESRLTRSTTLFPGIAELVAQLAGRGIAWGIVTNKHRRYTEPLMAYLEQGLARAAATIISGDSTPYPKPAPDNLLLAAQQLQLLPAACLYLGDDPRDITAGRAAGMSTVAVRYGYHSNNPSITDWGADHIIDQPLQTLALPGLA